MLNSLILALTGGALTHGALANDALTTEALAPSARSVARPASASPEQKSRAKKQTKKAVTWDVSARTKEKLHAYGAALAITPDVDGDDVQDVLVGAPCLGTDEPGYADLLSGATGKRIARFEGEQAGDEFGFAVAAGCDLDRNGQVEMVIGARAAAGGGARRGTVLVIDSRSLKPIRTISGTENHGFFGEALCCPGDVDRDGRGDLLVGAPGAAGARGHVLLFNGPELQPKQTLRGKSHGELFGSGISGLRDLNGDGAADFGVCAPLAGSRLPNSGCFVAYSGQTLRPLRSLYGPESMSWFGISAVNPGDLDGDEVDDFLVGAPATSLGELGGVGWVGSFSGASGDPIALYAGQNQGDFFGRSLSAGFDWNGDGIGDWAVGAPFAEGKRTSKRAGYVAVRSGAGSGPELKRFEGSEEGGLLGLSLATALPGTAGSASLLAGAPGRTGSAFRDTEQDREETSKPGYLRRFL